MIYLDLFRALEKHQVRYLLVGGLAMNLHGVPRMTMDVDLVLVMDEDNLDRFIACAGELNLTPSVPVPLKDLKNPEQRRFWHEHKRMIAFGLQNTQARIPTMVDVLIAPCIDIDLAMQRAVVRDLDGTQVLLASIEDMITLKTDTGRAQDESDIEFLERVRG